MQKSDITMPDKKKGGNQSAAHSALVNACLLAIGRIPGVIAFRTNSSAGGLMHQRGLPLGWPDITVLMAGGRVAFVECKTGAAKISQTQVDFAHAVHTVGVNVHVAHCADDAVLAIRGEFQR